ncbi:MAG: hypothetical protein MUC43_01910 [Pirellula sp.]|jgi:hypothetical protein|nr:hypothetical protein [Pirellula sp.]
MNLRQNLRIGLGRDAVLISTVLLAVAAGFLAYVSRLNDVTHDAFHEMALARELFEHGTLPLEDRFAFTPTVSPAVHHEWGTGVFLYLVAGASPLGLDGMAIARLILIALLGLCIYRAARNNGANPLVIGLCLPIAFPLAWVGFATLRAQLITLVFMAIQVLLQQSDWRERRSWVFAWMIMYVVWLNMHAGFVVGVAMLGLHVIERWLVYFSLNRNSFQLREFLERFWHHFVIAGFLVVGVMINPWGVRYPIYLWHAILMPRPTMLEWQPLWQMPDTVISIASFAFMAIGLGYAAKTRQWQRLRGWFFCCLAAYMALKHIRHGSLFAIAWMIYMPGWLTATEFGRSWLAILQNYRTTAIRMCWITGIASLLFFVQHSAWRCEIPSKHTESSMVYPVEAVEFLKRSEFKGNLITPFTAGAYVSWICHPNIRVSLDGRYEVAYRDDVLPKHDAFYHASPNWRDVLVEYDPDAILVKQTAPVRRLLGQKEHDTEHFRLVYEDSMFAVFVHDSLSVRTSASGRVSDNR